MPNILKNITPDPVSIRSGDATTLKVEYESAQLGDVQFVASAPFSISCNKAQLTPDPDGVRSVSMTIRRIDPHAGPRQCDILATFFQSSLHFFVEIT